MRKKQEILNMLPLRVVPSSEDDLNVREKLNNLSLQFKNSENDELFASRYTSQLIEVFLI